MGENSHKALGNREEPLVEEERRCVGAEETATALTFMAQVIRKELDREGVHWQVQEETQAGSLESLGRQPH